MFQVMLEIEKEWAANDSHRVTGNFDCEIAVSPMIALRKARAFLAGYVTLATSNQIPAMKERANAIATRLAPRAVAAV